MEAYCSAYPQALARNKQLQQLLSEPKNIQEELEANHYRLTQKNAWLLEENRQLAKEVISLRGVNLFPGGGTGASASSYYATVTRIL